MTNEEILGVAEILERATNWFNEQAARFREWSAAYDRLIAEMSADHEAKMAELGARTSADAKIIEGLRAAADEQVLSASKVAYVLRCAGETPVQAAQRVVKERDGLLTQVQDMRAEIARLKMACNAYAADWATAGKACRMRDNEYPLGAVIRLVRDDAERAEVAKRLVAERDALRTEVAALKSQTPRHPVKVGEWVKRTKKCAHLGHVAKVLAFIEPCSYEVQCIDGRGIWYFHNCEPCDPPNHDTEAGKAAAESAAKTEPVAEEIKVGDLVEVVSNRGRNTWFADVGSFGTVTSVEEINESISVHLDDVPGKKNALAGYVSFCDVRKVTP